MPYGLSRRLKVWVGRFVVGCTSSSLGFPVQTSFVPERLQIVVPFLLQWFPVRLPFVLKRVVAFSWWFFLALVPFPLGIMIVLSIQYLFPL